MFGAIIDDPIHLTVACSNKEKEEANSTKICRREALKHRFSSQNLAKVINTAESVTPHRHSDALEKQWFAFFEKFFELKMLFHDVYYELWYKKPDSVKSRFFEVV